MKNNLAIPGPNSWGLRTPGRSIRTGVCLSHTLKNKIRTFARASGIITRSRTRPRGQWTSRVSSTQARLLVTRNLKVRLRWIGVGWIYNCEKTFLRILQTLERQFGSRVMSWLIQYGTASHHLPLPPNARSTESRLSLRQCHQKEGSPGISLAKIVRSLIPLDVGRFKLAKPVAQRRVNAITNGLVADLVYNMESSASTKPQT
jgi:hypothetical protein